MHDRRLALASAALAGSLLAACASTPSGPAERAALPPLSQAQDSSAALPDYVTRPGYRKPTRAEAEQQLTAQRLADWQRSGADIASSTTTAAITSGVQPALVPAVQTTYVAAAAADAPPARTDYYRGDLYQGASIPPMPTAARPGECFALVRTPEQYRTVQHDFVARPGYDGIRVRPAQYTTQREEFIAQEAYERVEIIPPTFKTVTERVEVTPPSVRYLAGEPRYETVTEKVVERPARQVWKRGRGPVEKRDDATGEIMCLVEEPAVYRTVTRQVLKQEPQLREVQVPGEYRMVTRRVIDRPAEVRRVSIPEKRSSMQVQKLVTPGGYERVRIPDQMATLNTRELTAPSTLEWRPVLCETNMNPATVRRVQDALRRAGFDPGRSDGRPGKRTMDTLNAYQRAKGLPEDRYLNIQTLQSLGVSFG